MGFHDTINTGVTPNDGKGDGLRTNMRKLHDNTKDNKRRLDELKGNTPLVVSSNNGTILTPIDAIANINNVNNGSLKITLPVGFNNSMFRSKIDFYKSTTNYSFTLFLGGFLQPTGWVSTFAHVISSTQFNNLPVRFGNEKKPCIYIGELNHSWDYTKIAITELLVSHQNFEPALWLTGWDMAIESGYFQNVSQTHTNNLPVAQ
ncbi:hypothetical protein V2605_03945 [Tenacibaculum maritimum]|uniref:hypothetical protein n=1 Tax=Tenacibaculum maritimum TaxID=107401 RepID=UPI0038773357